MEKVLAFRFVSDRLPVLDVKYGQIVDGIFQPFEEMFTKLNEDLHSVALICEETEILGTNILLKVKDFGTVLYALYRLEDPMRIIRVETYPTFMAFHLTFDE